MEKFKRRIGPVAMVGVYIVAGDMLVVGFIILLIKAVPAMVEDLIAEEDV